MMCEFRIQILPEDAIEKFENPIGRERGFLKIKNATFLGIPQELRIRPRAVAFAKWRKSDFPTYAVVYNNENVTDCLFVFKFIKYADWDEYCVELTRCIGKTATKKRRIDVKDIIFEHAEMIRDFQDTDCLVIGVEEDFTK